MAKDDLGNAVKYHASGGLKTVLGVSFFATLLFLVNSAAGSVWLAAHNLPGDAFVFALMFGLGAVILLFATLFLFAVSHSSVTVGPDRALMTLPNWRGPTPMLPYLDVEVPYERIAAVETRGEVYRYLAIPVIVRAYSLVNHDGRRLTLGYVRENPQDPPLPFHEIAADIAKRVGTPVRDLGIVDAGSNFRAMLQDEPPWDAPNMPMERIVAQRTTASIIWRIVLSALIVIVVAAILYQASRLIRGV